jgi:hypothetical protein
MKGSDSESVGSSISSSRDQRFQVSGLTYREEGGGELVWFATAVFTCLRARQCHMSDRGELWLLGIT